MEPDLIRDMFGYYCVCQKCGHVKNSLDKAHPSPCPDTQDGSHLFVRRDANWLKAQKENQQ